MLLSFGRCATSSVVLVHLRTARTHSILSRTGSSQSVPCVARVVREPTRQFWREVGVWSALRHEHIVRFLGVCVSNQGPLSLCAHYPEGSVYDDNIRLRSSANSAAASHGWGLRTGWTLFTWVRQIVSAMHYLHGLDPWPVLYRNLKSSNLMLTEGKSKVCLTDFAICRPLAIHDDVTPAQGSDRWLAPEALLGQQFDLSCDVFSFGLTCETRTAQAPIPQRVTSLTSHRFSLFSQVGSWSRVRYRMPNNRAGKPQCSSSRACGPPSPPTAPTGSPDS